MRLIPLLALLALPAAAQQPRTPFDGPERTVLASTIVDVPLTKSGPFYYAEVRLNGRPFRFTLETGAGFFAISENAARALGVKLDSVEMRPGTRGAVTMIDSVSLPGGATFINVPASVTGMFTMLDFDGIISIPLLKQLLATVDLPASRLRLTRGSLPAPNGRDILPIAGRDIGGRIDIDVDFGGVHVPAVFDSRGMLGMILPDTLEKALRFSDTLRSIGGAYGPSLGQFTLRGAHLAGNTQIGGVQIPRAGITLRNRPGAVIGVPVMDQLTITIDQQNKRVQIARAGGAIATMPAELWETTGNIAGEGSTESARRQSNAAPTGRPMGFNIAGAPGGALGIINLVAGSNAEKAGLRNGDRLVELDGTPAASMSRDVFQRAAAKTVPVKIIITRDGQRLEFMVTPQPGQ